MPPTETQGDIRSDLEAAFEQHEPSENTQEVAEKAPEDTSQTTLEAPAATEAPATGSEASPPAAEAAPDTPTPSAEPGATPPADATAPAAEPVARAPGSWTPEARELWVQIPPRAREEIDRREREISRAMTQSAEARKFHSEFSAAMQPYMGFIAAEKSTPMQAVQYMMQTGAALRVGTPAQKAQLVAETIKNFGVDLRALDQILAGQQPSTDPMDQVNRLVEQRLAPIVGQFEAMQNRSQQAASAAAQSEIERFASDPKNEFFGDVQDLVADIIDLGLQRGQQVSLTDAYQRAILIHEPTRRVIEARKAREHAQQKTVVARAAQGTAASVAPSATVRQKQVTASDDVRSAIEKSIEQLQGQGR